MNHNGTYQQFLIDLIKMEQNRMSKTELKAKWTGNKWPTEGARTNALWLWKENKL
jgi:hypothetical protein